MVARGNEYEEILEIKKGKFLTLSRVFLFPNNVQDVRHGEWSTVSAWVTKKTLQVGCVLHLQRKAIVV